MPCGQQLIEAVADVLAKPDQTAYTPNEIRLGLGGLITTRAIRYAIAELIKQGRAKRKGQQGPVMWDKWT
jgi:predicted HTH transcriptional regulator